MSDFYTKFFVTTITGKRGSLSDQNFQQHRVAVFVVEYTVFFYKRQLIFFELRLGVLKFPAILSLQFSLSVLNFFNINKYINHI